MQRRLYALGSVAATTSASQQQTTDVRYTAFGTEQSYNGSLNTFGWNAKSQYQKDRDSGLMLLGHRYYDQSTGRFLSEDPARDGANWYTYCENNPLTAVDPSGLYAEMSTKTNKDGTSKVTITVHLEIRGDKKLNTLEMRQDIKEYIRDNWSGDYGKSQVFVKVDFTDKGNRNIIELRDGNGRSNAWYEAGRVSTWYPNDKSLGFTREQMVTHEAGHLMGLKDRYSERNTIMGDATLDVHTKEIQRIKLFHVLPKIQQTTANLQ